MPHLDIVNFYEKLSDSEVVANTHQGLMDVGRLPKWPRTETNVYLCGPLNFMRAQWLKLVEAGVPAARLHREVFGPELLDYLN